LAECGEQGRDLAKSLLTNMRSANRRVRNSPTTKLSPLTALIRLSSAGFAALGICRYGKRRRRRACSSVGASFWTCG